MRVNRSVVRYLCSDLLYLSMFIAIPTYCYVVLVDLLNFSWLQLWEFAWFSDIANSDVMLILACSWSGIEVIEATSRPSSLVWFRILNAYLKLYRRNFLRVFFFSIFVRKKCEVFYDFFICKKVTFWLTVTCVVSNEQII